MGLHKSDHHQVVKCGSRRSFEGLSGVEQFIKIIGRCLESREKKMQEEWGT